MSNGSYLVFLDADDRLLPEAVEVGLECFNQHPEVAFVSGRFRFIAADGTTLYERQGHRVDRNHYAEMLRRNYIAALCGQRCAGGRCSNAIAGFNPLLSIVADYDLYLRVLHEFPVWSHDREVAEYRRHGLGISTQPGQMLKEALFALRAQRPHVADDPTLAQAYRSGVRYWKALTAEFVARQVRADWQDGRRGSAVSGVAAARPLRMGGSRAAGAARLCGAARMIFGVMMVRNEADILRINLLYHLASGIDQVLVVDNGSTDGTAAILEGFAEHEARPRVFASRRLPPGGDHHRVRPGGVSARRAMGRADRCRRVLVHPCRTPARRS